MKFKPLTLGVSAGFAYALSVAASTALIHTYARDTIEPVVARNIKVFGTAPIFAEARRSGQLNQWPEQQRKIGLRLISNNITVDWRVSNFFNEQGQHQADLLKLHNIALLPELDKAAKPNLVVDDFSGCLNLIPAASAQRSSIDAANLLNKFEQVGKKPGTYALSGDGIDSFIVRVDLPANKTAQSLCSNVRPKSLILAK